MDGLPPSRLAGERVTDDGVAGSTVRTVDALFPAEDALAQVKLARVQASVSLFRALGGGWH